MAPLVAKEKRSVHRCSLWTVICNRFVMYIAGKRLHLLYELAEMWNGKNIEIVGKIKSKLCHKYDNCHSMLGF